MTCRFRGIGLGGLLALLLTAGCDLPTGAPSIDTEATVDAPVLAEKTFSFLGGPASEHEPLLDTTRTGLDTLLSVEASDRTVFVEQEVSNFGLGTVDGVLDASARGLAVDTTVARSIAAADTIVTQPVRAVAERRIEVFESSADEASTPVPNPSDASTVETAFPIEALVEPPTTAAVDAREATVESVRLTGASENRLAFTLTNGRPQGTPLTNGTSGEAPEIALRNAEGEDPLSFTSFGNGPIGPGESRTVVADVPGARLGRGTTIVLRLQNSDENDVLTTAARSGLWAEAVTLSDPDRIEVGVTATGVETRGPGASRFAGLVVDRGALDVRLRNALSFPIAVEQFSLQNRLPPDSPLPDGFPALDVALEAEGATEVETGGSHIWSADLAGRGVARRVDVALQGRPATTSGTVTLRAGDGIAIAGTGRPAIAKMHFWPEGERLRDKGRVSLDGGPVTFERAGDFVELASGTLRLRELVSELEVGFDSLTISFPGIRRPDANEDGRQYAPGDSLTIAFVEQPDGPFEFEAIEPGASRSESISAGPMRFVPDGNTLIYHLQATLNTAPDTTAQSLRTLRVEDEIRTGLSWKQLDVEAIRATVRPFTVGLTPDADGDGRRDLADDAEARTASFSGFRGLSRRVEGLQLRDGRFTFSVETDLGTDTRLYGAVEGRHRDGARLLGGKGPQRVSSADPVVGTFERSGTPIEAENLLQFDVAAGPPHELVTRSLTLTDDNADVDAFLGRLPTRLRFVGTSRIAGGRVDLRAPVHFDVGLGLRLPLSFEGTFSYRDTLDSDLSDLSVLADPAKEVSIASARLQVDYVNDVPVGFDAALVALDENGRRTMTLPGEEGALTLAAAPKTDEGTAASAREGTLTLDLTAEEIRTLARADQLQLRLRMNQQADGPAARVRADDTIRLSLAADVDASVRVGD